ncbi:hypothetical protein [uncultured Cohaesibacter sp.]|uniref:hypothetical protein n=1 Tax=uncultured Cohaesibacter sp. TaxID=1002546 RepID=UPI0029C97B66|nr:hypothetical protein [uncultured Cohaesibacter sp.]
MTAIYIPAPARLTLTERLQAFPLLDTTVRAIGITVGSVGIVFTLIAIFGA